MHHPVPMLDYARPRTARHAQITKFDRFVTFVTRIGPPLMLMGGLLMLMLVVSVHLAIALLVIVAARLGYALWRKLHYRAQIRLWNRREAAGFCPFCNYDLRGTPTCCPECGEEPPELYRRRLHQQIWPNDPPPIDLPRRRL